MATFRTHVSTFELGEALGWTPKMVRRAADTGRIPPPIRGIGPGSHRRWTVVVAAKIVRAAGRVVPSWWGAPAAAA